jgi:hypothetical protein
MGSVQQRELFIRFSMLLMSNYLRTFIVNPQHAKLLSLPFFPAVMDYSATGLIVKLLRLGQVCHNSFHKNSL